MKYISMLVSVGVLMASGLAQAETSGATAKYSLMKCGSMQLGTLWISFGHRYTSGETQIQHFPSEVVYISTEEKIQRRSFRNGKEALAETSTQVFGGVIELNLHSPWGATSDGHALSVVMADPRAPGAFKGTWEVLSKGQTVAIDRNVRCMAL